MLPVWGRPTTLSFSTPGAPGKTTCLELGTPYEMPACSVCASAVGWFPTIPRFLNQQDYISFKADVNHNLGRALFDPAPDSNHGSGRRFR
jgi:hypothetical protein